MSQPKCRRALAEGLSIENSTLGNLQELRQLTRSGDADLRFHAVYALGSMLHQFDSTTKPTLQLPIAEILLAIADDLQEHLDVRRMAATMLHLHGHLMPSFFAAKSCLYGTRSTACDVISGLTEVYSTLRRMVGQGSSR